MFEYLPSLLSFWVKSSTKNPMYNTLFVFIEFLTFWIECFNSFARLLGEEEKIILMNHDDNANRDNDTKFLHLNTLNPIHYLKKFIFSENLKISDCSSSLNCSMNNLLTLIIAIVITTIILVHHLWGYLSHLKIKNTNTKKDSKNNNNNSSEGSKFLNFLLINFLDLIFKIFGIFIFFIFFNKMIVSFYLNSDIVYAVISLIFLIFFTFFSFFQINYIVLFMRLDSHDSLYYDKFSKNYNTLIFVLKIIIALNNNLIFICNDDKASVMRIITALDYLLIICLFSYTAKMLWNIVFDRNLIFVTNYKFNLLRLFNMTFVCTYILINLFFGMISVYELVLNLISSLLISGSIIIYSIKKVDVCLFEDEKMVYTLTYLLNLLLHGDSMNHKFQITAIKVKSFHSIRCKNGNKCQICQQSDIIISQEIHNPDKLNLLSSLFKHIEENTLHKLSTEETNFFKLIQIIFEYHLTLLDSSIPRFNIIYKLKDLIMINQETKNNYYHNLLLLYSKINHQSDSEVTKFSVVKNYDSSLSSLKKSIDIVKDIVDTLESRVKKDLYPQTNQLNNLKLNLLKKFEQIYTEKNSFNDNYSFLMTKYIFERTFNFEANSVSKILYGSDDLEYRQDFIQDHFIKDKILIIKHDHMTKSLIITRASKELSSFIGKNFETLFPENFRECGKKKFIDEILNNQENFKFEFLIDKIDKIDKISKLNQSSPLKFIQNLKLDCKIFRSPDLQEIFIISNYEITEEEILVFQTPIVYNVKKNISDHNFDNTNLITFSEHLEQTLLLDPMIIETIAISKLPKRNLNFNDIFSKGNLSSSKNKNYRDSNNLALEESDSSSSSLIEFVINYKTYYSNFFSTLEQNYQSIENQDLNFQNFINQARELSERNYSINCRLKLKYFFMKFSKNENSEIFIFSFKNFSPKNPYNYNILQLNNTGNNKDKNDEKNYSKNPENKFYADESSDNLINNQLLNFNNQSSSTSVSSSVNSTKTNQSLLNQSILSSISINGKKSTLNESDKKMVNFTIMTLFINFCLGLYCIFFLFMGFSSNNKMKELNLLKKNFNNFERMFYQTALSQFYNVGVYKQGTTYMDDYLFGGYWDQFAGTGLTISMGDYANSELYVKADFLKEDMNILQNFIYNPNSIYREQLEPIFNFNTVYKVLYTSEDNELKLQSRNPNFFETILMFMNNAKASVFYTTNTMIYIHNYDLHTGNYDFSSFFNKNVTNVQKAVYEAIFNFPVYLNNLNKIWWEVEKLYYSQVDEIFNLNLYLSLILIVLHVFLIIVSFSIISFLKKTIRESNYIYAKVVTGDWARYLTMKLLILKETINFYKIDPIKNSTKLKKELQDSAKIMKDNQEKEKSSGIIFEEKISLIDHCEEAHVSYQNLISPLKKVLFLLFSFYLIYAFSFILIFDNSKKDIILTSKFAAEYLQVDKGIMNSILLLQCIVFSNQTDYSLNQFMKNYKNFTSDPEHENGYIWDTIEDAKLSRNYISYLENNYPKIAKVEQKANEIAWCEYLYNNIDDDIFSVTKKSFPENTLAENLVILCKHYPVMNLSYYKNLITEINYIAAKMVRSYLHSYPDYTLMKKTNDETEFFDEFTIAVMIIRPIQTYLLENDIANLTKSTEDNFVAIVIIFMIGNILVECLIFFVINRKLISRVLTINEEIRCLTLCLTA
jgi:hypothetical protein